jgi:hypothetical protein
MNHSANGNRPIPATNDPASLETRHFELTRELFELRAKLRSRAGVPSGQAGHLRKQAQALKAQIELLELAIGARDVEKRAAERAQTAPPRSRAFLEDFYAAARQRLPAELIRQLEAAAKETKPG